MGEAGAGSGVRVHRGDCWAAGKELRAISRERALPEPADGYRPAMCAARTDPWAWRESRDRCCGSGGMGAVRLTSEVSEVNPTTHQAGVAPRAGGDGK
ncbi:DUF6233 domain-containing protein [Streptomyces sp. NPDC058637]|uniref:DUF6233 domain-containing protein n=1 Tax=Streptomyces sp. NPDC058637 TaxID=3346569 RepID=UPI00364B6E3C